MPETDAMKISRKKEMKKIIRGFQKLMVPLLAVILGACVGGQSIEEQPVIESGPILPTQTPAPLPTPSSLPETSVRGEVVVWMAYDPFELEGLQAVIDTFAARNPDIAFALAYYPEDELLEAFKTLSPSGRGPTILIGPSQWGPELYAQGDILDLGALIDAELEEDVYPVAWTQARSDFAVRGLPLELKGVLLYRNRELASDSPTTMADWAALTAELTAQEGIETSLDFGFQFSGSFLYACGGRLERSSDQAQLWGPVGLCWLDLLRDMAVDARVVFDSEEDYEAFISGSSPWLIDLAERRPALRAALGGDNLAVTPWPVNSQQSLPLRGYVWTENIYIVAGTPTRNLEAAWAFARYLLTPEAQTMLSDPAMAGHIPVVASAELEDPLMVESSAMLRTGVPWPLELSDQEFLDVLETAASNVVLQGSIPEFALNFAQKSLGLPITAIPTATTAAP
jgi:ABC-type glycerol-3-phosphate transport system substrate-binding protein